VKGFCTREHNMAGKHLGLMGEFFGSWRAWDAIRGLDYLLSRPDVDPKRIGVTGNSGGGTMTTWVNALDDRITMAAPSCFVTANLFNLKNELPADSEQIVPLCSGNGLELWDFIIARAPRSTIILAKNNDFFDYRGSKIAYEQCLKVYRLLGAENNIKLYIGEGNHGYSLCNREAMYQFFCEKAKINDNGLEPKIEIFSEEKLRCTPEGQILSQDHEKSIGETASEMASAMRLKRKPMTPSALKDKVIEVLNCTAKGTVPSYRTLRVCTLQEDGVPAKQIDRFAVETEPGIQCFLEHIEKDDMRYNYLAKIPQKKALLYIAHHSYEKEYKIKCAQSQNKDTAVFGYEVRGIGLSKPQTCNDDNYFSIYGFDYLYASMGLMLNESYLGRKVHDVLCAAALLKDSGFEEIELSGYGMGAIVAAFAALLHSNFSTVTLSMVPKSFEEIIQAQINTFPQSHLPYGILKHADLPDIFNALGDSLQIEDFCANGELPRN